MKKFIQSALSGHNVGSIHIHLTPIAGSSSDIYVDFGLTDLDALGAAVGE